MSILKTGVNTSNRFSEVGILEDMQIKALSDGSVWIKVFEHNNKSGTVLFTTVAEVKNTQTTDKYSRLYLLDYLRDSRGKYEFILEYPDNLANQYNRWKQTNNPLNEFVTETSAGTGVATGYEAVSIAWNTYYWGGLTRQSSDASAFNNTYLSGSVGHVNWYYAVGSRSAWNGGIPGPSSAITGRTQVWLRADTLNGVNKASIAKYCCVARNFIEY